MPRAKQTQPEQQTIDIDNLVNHIREQVKKELTAEIEGKLQVALMTINQASEQRKEKITLTGQHKFSLESNLDGLVFAKDDQPVFTVGKGGQIASGTSSPRSYGKGSAHFKSGYSSEAIIPTVGDGSTRGVIVEGDGDDDKTFIFRAVSRMNRQGVNVFSDGSLGIGKMQKTNGETLGIYHRQDDYDAVRIDVPAQSFTGTAVSVNLASHQNKKTKAITVSVGSDTSVYEVNTEGDQFLAGQMYSNHTGYTEFFEWQDGNAREEDRNGFTVTFTEQGQIRIANEDDKVIGVVVHTGAIVGNTKWNHWRQKYSSDLWNKRSSKAFDIVEWLEMETTKIVSHDRSLLSKDFALPENAVIIQTDDEGRDITKPKLNQVWSTSHEYVPRHNRSAWATVAFLGTVPVYKGQTVGTNWIKIKELNDEVDLYLLK